MDKDYLLEAEKILMNFSGLDGSRASNQYLEDASNLFQKYCNLIAEIEEHDREEEKETIFKEIEAIYKRNIDSIA